MESVEKVDLFMPLFVGDYLKDTGDLTAEEHGAYMLLMMHMWNRGGSLPLDHARLCRLAAVERERWPAVWGEIDRFFDVEAGRVTQKRVNAELEKARKAKADKARAGRQGGLASAAERQSRNGAGHQADGKQTSSSGQADSQAESNPPSPSPSPSGSPPGSPHADPAPARAPAIPGPVPRAPDPPKPPSLPVPPRRARPSGYDLQHLFGQIRSEILGGMPWTIPPDARGTASSFAERLTDDAVPDVEPTMRLMFERIRDRRKDWTDDRLREDASFAFGAWRSKFTQLREMRHRREPAGAPPAMSTKAHINGEHICFPHREMPDKPASERDPLCGICQRMAPRRKRWGEGAEPVSIADVITGGEPGR